MIRAIKAVSTERGRDPREFTLVAFGGNGPVFACGMAAALGMQRVVVPPSPGLFSFRAALRRRRAPLFAHPAAAAAQDRPARDRARLGACSTAGARSARGRASLGQGEDPAPAALHYHGQTYELTVPLPDGPIDHACLEEAFGREHERPTATAPAPTSRSSWSRSRSSARACAKARPCPSACAPAGPSPRRHLPRARLFRLLDRTPVLRRSDLRTGARALDRRGVRRDLRRAARRAGNRPGGNIVVDLSARGGKKGRPASPCRLD